MSIQFETAKFFGDRLRELRVRHGLTQEQAAVLCGMEYKYYQMVEWGRKNLRLDTMERVTGAFGLRVRDMFQEAGLPESAIVGVPQVADAPHRPRKSRGRPRK